MDCTCKGFKAPGESGHPLYNGPVEREPGAVRACYHCGNATVSREHNASCPRCLTGGSRYALKGRLELEARLAHYDRYSGHDANCEVYQLLRGRYLTAIASINACWNPGAFEPVGFGVKNGMATRGKMKRTQTTVAVRIYLHEVVC